MKIANLFMKNLKFIILGLTLIVAGIFIFNFLNKVDYDKEHKEELSKLLNGITEMKITNSSGYKIAQTIDDGYTIFGDGNIDQLAVMTHYNGGNAITLSVGLDEFFINSKDASKEQFLNNVYELAEVKKEDQVLIDMFSVNNFTSNYNLNATSLIHVGANDNRNIEELKNHNLMFLTSRALEYSNADDEFGNLIKDFLSSGKTIIFGGAISNRLDYYPNFLGDLGVRVTKDKREVTNFQVNDITVEKMMDTNIIKRINELKEIEDENLSTEVSSSEIQALANYYSVEGFGDSEYKDLNIKFPYTFEENSPYTRALVYGRFMTTSLEAGQSKDESIYYKDKEELNGDVHDVSMCLDTFFLVDIIYNHFNPDCNKRVTSTFNLKSTEVRTTHGGDYTKATGLYLQPGEDIKVEIKINSMSESFDETVNSPVYFSIAPEFSRLQVNAETFNRSPQLTRNVYLNEGEHIISSGTGGPIYIKAVPNLEDVDIEVKITNAIRMPVYEQGVTSIEHFESQLENFNVDRVLFISESNMVSSTRENALSYLEQNSVDKALDELDEIYQNNVNLRLGTTNEGIYKHPTEDHRLWWQEDIQIHAGWMLSGYPIHTHASYGILNNFEKTIGEPNRWGEAHELGHNTQYNFIGFANTVEVTVNINSLNQEYQRNEDLRIYTETRDDFTNLIEYFDEGNKIGAWGVPNDNEAGLDYALTFYTQLATAYHYHSGYKEGEMFDIYTILSKNELYYYSLYHWNVLRQEMMSGIYGFADIPISNNYEYLYVEACKIFGFDIYEMLTYYGVGVGIKDIEGVMTISEEIRNAMKDKYDPYEKINTPMGELYMHQIHPENLGEAQK